jgi:hypothetical protein
VIPGFLLNGTLSKSRNPCNRKSAISNKKTSHWEVFSIRRHSVPAFSQQADLIFKR